jgi:hypothetical protein
VILTSTALVSRRTDIDGSEIPCARGRTDIRMCEGRVNEGDWHMHRPAFQLFAVGILMALGIPQLQAQSKDWSWRKERPSVEAARKLAQRVNFAGFDDPKLTLGAAMTTLQTKYDLSLSVNEKAFKFAEIPDVLALPIARAPLPAMRNVPLAAVMRAVIARVSPKATFIYDSDGIEITTRGFALLEAREEVYALFSDCELQVRSSRRFGIDGITLTRDLGAFFYWNHVLSENVNVILAEAPTFPKGEPFPDIPIRVPGTPVMFP